MTYSITDKFVKFLEESQSLTTSDAKSLGTKLLVEALQLADKSQWGGCLFMLTAKVTDKYKVAILIDGVSRHISMYSIQRIEQPLDLQPEYFDLVIETKYYNKVILLDTLTPDGNGFTTAAGAFFTINDEDIEGHCKSIYIPKLQSNYDVFRPYIDALREIQQGLIQKCKDKNKDIFEEFDAFGTFLTGGDFEKYEKSCEQYHLLCEPFVVRYNERPQEDLFGRSPFFIVKALDCLFRIVAVIYR